MMAVRLFFLFICSFFCINPSLGADGAKRPMSPTEESSSQKKFRKTEKQEQEKEEEKLSQLSEIVLPPQEVNPFKFKIGFEFQLTGDLFPHYKENKLFQKKPLFSVSSINSSSSSSHNRRLWHAEIDGANIEFVTAPFSYQERENLARCLGSIQDAFLSLHKFVMANRHSDQIVFSHWVEILEKELKKSGLVINRDYPNFNEFHMVYPVRRQNKWMPLFQPQVTLQHPLEYTIPISFALLGFDDGWMMSHLLGGLPDYNIQSNDMLKDFNNFNMNIKEGNLVNFFKDKMYGLSFLHALTMASMTINDLTKEFRPKGQHESDKDYENSYFLFEVSEKLKRNNQIDLKDRITLMSRRSFSSMYSDIKIPINYVAFFKEHIENGNVYFSDFLQVPIVFFKTNYAEQLFDPHGNLRNLSNFSAHFQEDFYHKNKEVVDELLKKGVVGTVMVRNFKDAHVSNIFHGYYEESIKSVQSSSYRYELDFDRHDVGNVEQVQWKYDMLSPPWLLDRQNSMGTFTEDAMYDIQEYGEAIIEYRSISSVGTFFMEKAELLNSINDGYFLTDPIQITSQGIKLFDFLNKFREDSNILNEVNVGITYSLIKQKIKETRNWQ